MCGEKRITDAKGRSLPRLRELLIGGLAGGVVGGEVDDNEGQFGEVGGDYLVGKKKLHSNVVAHEGGGNDELVEEMHCY